jgi:hypothetical protein
LEISLEITGHAYDNPEKCKSRELIAREINSYITEPVTMLEFLGNGTGLKYYVENIKNLNIVVGIEKNIKAFDAWCDNDIDVADNLKTKRTAVRCSIDNFVRSDSNKRKRLDSMLWRKHRIDIDKFNVVSLDFCTYFYDNNSPRSPLRAVEALFDSNILSNKSLVIFTFMVQGWNIQLQKDNMEILTTSETISTVLTNTIENSGKYKVREHILDYEYTSCGRGLKTKMLNLFFTIDKIKEVSQ